MSNIALAHGQGALHGLSLLRVSISEQTQNICITFIQRRPNVFDVGPTLSTRYTNILCLL